uniref:Uncharacterized protein n=1 Tax=Jaculus jaculus TaxID=51337 RepID=A0A8C5JV95_JACJA
MRRLNRKKTLNLVKELDAFPKVPDSYVETSASGGTGEWSARSLEVMWGQCVYMCKLRINIDITVAMRCQCKYVFSPFKCTEFLLLRS